MLSIFRNNQVTTSIFLLVYAALLRLPVWLGWVHMPAVAFQAPAGFLYLQLPEWLRSTGVLSAILAMFLVCAQAFWINSLVDRFRIMDERNWLPGLAYVLIASVLPEQLWLSAPLIAITVVPAVFGDVFSMYKKADVTAASLNSGFWLGVGSLFYPMLLLLFPVVILSVRSLRSFNLRERFVLFAGLFTPYFLAWVFAFWFDSTSQFWQVFKEGFPFAFLSAWPPVSIGEWSKFGIVSLLLLVVLLSLGIYYYKKLIQVQKYINSLMWSILVSVLALILVNTPPALHFWMMVPFLAILWGMTFTGIRNKTMTELLHLLVLAALFWIQFFPNSL